MKNLSAAFLKKLANETTSFCHCWRLSRSDGIVQGFTDHDHALNFLGLEFKAMSGFEASSISEMLGLNIDTQEVAGALSSDQITEQDILAGRYDNARIEIYLVDWKEPNYHFLIKLGNIGEITRSDQQFNAEMRGITAPLDQTQGRYFAHACDADLGDARCKINLNNSQYSKQGSVSAVSDKLVIEINGISNFKSGWLSYGKITWLSGENKDLSVEIAAHSKRGNKSIIQLWQKMPFPINNGDGVKVFAGCNKTFQICKSKFSNSNNFQGFPHLPGNDFLMKFAKRGNVYDGKALIK